VRGCSEKFSGILGKGFRVIEILKPNANAGVIIEYKYLKTKELSKNDVVIFFCGARDVARTETRKL
jgi:hypothetical protein